MVQNPGPDTWCVIAGSENMRVKNLTFSDRHDLVWAEWLLLCLRRREVVPWQPRHMIHMSPSTREHFAKEYDAFGDSFSADTDPDQLREVFQRISHVDPDLDVAQVEARYGWDDLPMSMFRPFTVYVDLYEDPGESQRRRDVTRLDIRALELELHGASVEKVLTEGITHAVVENPDRLLQLRTLRRTFRRKFKIVSEDWVTDSISEGRALSEEPYML